MQVASLWLLSPLQPVSCRLRPLPQVVVWGVLRRPLSQVMFPQAMMNMGNRPRQAVGGTSGQRSEGSGEGSPRHGWGSQSGRLTSILASTLANPFPSLFQSQLGDTSLGQVLKWVARPQGHARAPPQQPCASRACFLRCEDRTPRGRRIQEISFLKVPPSSRHRQWAGKEGFRSRPSAPNAWFSGSSPHGEVWSLGAGLTGHPQT